MIIYVLPTQGALGLAAVMIDPKAIGQRVRERRTAMGISQAVLAEQAGVTDETISRLERGTFEPSLSTLVAVASVLSSSLDFLVGRPGRAPKAASATRDGMTLERLLSRARRLDGKTQQALLRLAELLPEREQSR